MANYIGMKLKDFQGSTIEIVSYNENFKMYQGKETNVNGIVTNPLLNDDDIEFYISKQQEIKAYEEKTQKVKSEQSKKEEEEKTEYENVNGFCDNLSPMQKARTLKTLNTEIRYNGKWMTRKSFVLHLILEGYTPTIKDKVMSSNRKIQGERIVKYKYNVPTLVNDNRFYEVTKTEYNYALYLLDNVA